MLTWVPAVLPPRGRNARCREHRRQDDCEHTAGGIRAAKPVAKPVGGIGLGLAAVWALIKNFFRRLFGGGSKAS